MCVVDIKHKGTGHMDPAVIFVIIAISALLCAVISFAVYSSCCRSEPRASGYNGEFY